MRPLFMYLTWCQRFNVRNKYRNLFDEMSDDKPMRMEVPNRHKLPELKDPLTNLPVEEDSPKRATLKLRKVLTSNAQPEPVCMTPKAVEERVKIYEDMKHKRWRRRVFGSICDVIIILLAFLTMWYVYMMWQNHTQSQLLKERELREAENARQNELELKRAQEREKMKQEENERQAKIKAEKAAAEEAKRVAEQERKDSVELYKIMTYALRENDFYLFGSSVTNKLIGSGQKLCYLLPVETEVLPVYCVSYVENSSKREIFKLMPNGEKSNIDEVEFDSLLKNKDYLVATDGKSYFKSKRRKPQSGILSKKQDGDPAEIFFGSLWPVLQRLDPAFDDLTFDICFLSKDGKKIFIENLEFGCKYSLEKVKGVIANEYARKAIPAGTLKFAKYNRTAKLYNGAVVKRGVDGITYVPRTQPARRLYGATSTYSLNGYRTIYDSRKAKYIQSDNWHALYTQAIKEDSEEKEFYEKQKRDFLENRQRKLSAAERDWEKKLEKIFNEGTIIYAIKRAPVNKD